MTMEDQAAKITECGGDHFITDILFSDCAICKHCCRMIYEGVCGYHIVHEMNCGALPAEFQNKLVIFRVAEADLDWLALSWVHYPKENLLYAITLPQNGGYEFLMLPWLREGCPLLTPTGCKYPAVKLFDCRLFPYYFQKGELKIDSDCKPAKHWNLDDGRRLTQKLTDDYAQFCKTNQQAYFRELEAIKRKYAIPLYYIDRNAVNVCAAASWHYEPEKWK